MSSCVRWRPAALFNFPRWIRIRPTPTFQCTIVSPLSTFRRAGFFQLFDRSEVIGARKARPTLAPGPFIIKMGAAHQRQPESAGRLAIPLIQDAEANRDDLSIAICFGRTHLPHGQ